VGVLGLTCYRPFPVDAVRAAVSSARRVVVIERALALGEDGPIAADVARAVAGPGRSVSTVVCGLGGRPVTSAVLHRLLDRVARDDLPHRLFLDLDREVVDRELHRTAALALQAAEVRT
jgi:pyruvate ferredoxin oxidoreductase alpha subunit